MILHPDYLRVIVKSGRSRYNLGVPAAGRRNAMATCGEVNARVAPAALTVDAVELRVVIAF